MPYDLSAIARCKKAIDLLGDALLSRGLTTSQLEHIEHGLMCAIDWGTVDCLLDAKANRRQATTLLKAWQVKRRKDEIQKLRKEGAGK